MPSGRTSAPIALTVYPGCGSPSSNARPQNPASLQPSQPSQPSSTSQQQGPVKGQSQTTPGAASTTTASTSSSLRTSPQSPSSKSFFKTWAGAISTALGLVLAALGVVSTFYSGFIGLRMQKWSARNDVLQSCLSFRSNGRTSDFCNRTIEAGVTPPRIVKRAMVAIKYAVSSGEPLKSPLAFTVTVVLTLVVAVLTIVYSRPRMRPFHPIVSLVRVQPYDISNYTIIVTACATTTSIMEDTLRKLPVIFEARRPPPPGKLTHALTMRAVLTSTTIPIGAMMSPLTRTSEVMSLSITSEITMILRRASGMKTSK